MTSPENECDDLKYFSPMTEAFQDPAFNKYIKGPGQDLDDDLQPGTTAIKKSESNLNCRIALKKVPLSLKKNGLLNLCNQYGKVVDIHVPKNWPDQNPFIYVEYSSVSEAEKALREIPSNKTWNIICKFATRKERNDKENPVFPDTADFNGNSNNSNGYLNPSTGNSINMAFTSGSRYSHFPKTNPAKINYPKVVPLVSEEDYNNPKLNEADPDKHFQIQKDSRRSYYSEDPTIIKNLQEMALSSKGQYNPETPLNNSVTSQHTYSSNGMTKERKLMAIETCNYCHELADKHCGTCSIAYCSIECQKHDWQDHIKYCRPMPTLIAKPFKTLTPSQVDKMEMSSEEAPTNMLEQYIKNCHESLKSESQEDAGELTPDKVLNKSMNEPKNNNVSEDTINSTPKMYGDFKQKKSSAVPIIDKPKLHSRVVLTSVSDSKVFYLRPIDNDYNESFQKLINNIQLYSGKARLITKTPEKYDVFLAPFQEEYCRVFILNVNVQNESCFVSYLDYGNTGDVSFHDLRCINNQTKLLKRHTFKVILTEVNANKENPDVQEYVNSLLENNTELVITKYHEKGHNTYVELFEVQNKICVNNKLNQLSEIPEATYESQSYYLTDICTETFPSGENVKLYVTDISNLENTGVISCILTDNLLKHHEIYNLVQDYGNKSADTVFSPKINELCLAKSQDEWYRAAGLETVGDGEPTIVFLDIGNFGKVKVANLRKMPKQLMMPVFQHYGTIQGFNSENEKLIELLKNEIKVNQTIVARIIIQSKSEDEEYIFEFDFVNEFLTNQQQGE